MIFWALSRPVVPEPPETRGQEPPETRGQGSRRIRRAPATERRPPIYSSVALTLISTPASAREIGQPLLASAAACANAA